MKRVLEPEIMDNPERAQAYAQADFAQVNAAFVQRLLERAGTTRPCTALDLGCGPGDIALQVAAARPHWRIVAADASVPMLALAGRARRDSRRRNVRFVRADATRLPHPDACFDVAFSNSLLHHLPDPLPFWHEIQRVATPDATILVRDLVRPDTEAGARRWVDIYAAEEHPLLREDFYRSFLAAFTLEEIREQVRAFPGNRRATCHRIGDRHVDIDLGPRSEPVDRLPDEQ